MELPFFFQAEAVIGQLVTLDEANSRHAIQVLRLQKGDSMQLTNGQGLLWTATIDDVGKKKCTVKIELEEGQVRKSSRKSAIAISPIKNTGRFEWFLEKATELGIADIFPVICHRTERAHFRFDRMRQILISGMLQSRQVWMPALHEPVPFSAFVTGNAGHQYHNRWIAHCESYEKHELAHALQPGMHDSILMIGPEGDFTVEEIFEATSAGFIPVSLGNTRLRTETAGIVGAALLCLG
jgi:16S rRNA (uracil1498-N3)-methyltransferase